MMGQGLGPGFTIVATRRSVIFSLEGREFVLTFLGETSVASVATRALPSTPTEAARISRRPNTCWAFLLMVLFPFHRSPSSERLAASERPGLLEIAQVSRLTNHLSFESFGRNFTMVKLGRCSHGQMGSTTL